MVEEVEVVKMVEGCGRGELGADAAGNPGLREKKVDALRGRHKRDSTACCAPSGRRSAAKRQPRVSPWAVTLCPFGAAFLRGPFGGGKSRYRYRFPLWIAHGRSAILNTRQLPAGTGAGAPPVICFRVLLSAFSTPLRGILSGYFAREFPMTNVHFSAGNF